MKSKSDIIDVIESFCLLEYETEIINYFNWLKNNFKVYENHFNGSEDITILNGSPFNMINLNLMLISALHKAGVKIEVKPIKVEHKMIYKIKYSKFYDEKFYLDIINEQFNIFAVDYKDKSDVINFNNGIFGFKKLMNIKENSIDLVFLHSLDI